MHRGFMRWAAVFGGLAVALGAFGAHALKDFLTTRSLEIYETGVRYQFYHALALAVVALSFNVVPGKKLLWAGRFFIAGIFIFSFSLYVLAWATNYNNSFNWIGAITPFGGFCFILGWLMLLLAVGGKTNSA